MSGASKHGMATGHRRRSLHTLEIGQDDDQELWLISYADMMTLLFAVFVVVVAIVGLAPPAPGPSPAVAQSALTTWELLLQRREADSDREAEPSPRAALSPDQIVVEGPAALRDRWMDYLRRVNLENAVEVQVLDSRINLIVRDRILFDSGRAALERDGLSVLQRLSLLLGAVSGAITVEGHTDNVAVRGGRFRSNWDLSGARAAAVVDTLTEFGVPPNRLRIAGYADTRPVADNSTPEGRTVNRRVVFVIEP